MEENIQKKISQFLEIERYGNESDAESQLEYAPQIKSPLEKLFYVIWSFIPLHGSINLIPQHPVKNYFIDFKISFIDYFVNSQIEYTTKELFLINSILPLYAIEIDGHDFHEKTKSQVEKDKIRERAIITEGYKVLRFSGSEVFNNASKCVVDCYYAYQQDFNQCIKKIQYSKVNIYALD